MGGVLVKIDIEKELDLLDHNILIKLKPEIEEMPIFYYNNYFCSEYTDGITIFLKDIISIKHNVDTFFRTFLD